MHILFDGNALQSQAHLLSFGPQPAGVRLEELLANLRKRLSAAVDFSKNGKPLTSEQLENADVLAIPTRPPEGSGWPDPAPFSNSELTDIETFVEEGGGAVLFTNHPPFTSEDARLASRFGIGITDRTAGEGEGNQVLLEEGQMHSHSITDGSSRDGMVRRVRVNNSGVLSKQVGTVEPVVGFAFSQSLFFSLAAERGQGRAVVVGDSGILGSKNPQGRSVPGPGGYIDVADNRTFILNAFRWADGKLG